MKIHDWLFKKSELEPEPEPMPVIPTTLSGDALKEKQKRFKGYKCHVCDKPHRECAHTPNDDLDRFVGESEIDDYYQMRSVWIDETWMRMSCKHCGWRCAVTDFCRAPHHAEVRAIEHAWACPDWVSRELTFTKEPVAPGKKPPL